MRRTRVRNSLRGAIGATGGRNLYGLPRATSKWAPTVAVQGHEAWRSVFADADAGGVAPDHEAMGSWAFGLAAVLLALAGCGGESVGEARLALGTSCGQAAADPHQSCTISPDGGVICGPCPDGYEQTSPTTCVIVNECATNNGGCDPLTTCTNLSPGFRSAGTLQGYSGTGSNRLHAHRRMRDEQWRLRSARPARAPRRRTR